jgi:hypothetical protein
MSEPETPLSKQDQLAIAIARGKSVPAWARQNDVPRTTAYRWARDPDVRRLADDCRRRSVERALGWMTGHSLWAVKRIKKLAETADSDSVQLRALRTFVDDVIKVSDFANLEYRVAEMEEEDRARDAGAACPA